MGTILEDLNFCNRLCKYCRLSQTRDKVVCGEGRIPTKFLFIAQAPGRSEDRQGRILVGPSGKIFDSLVESVGMQRSEIYITNLLKCFLPRCRKPRHDEMETCYNLYLKKEIEVVKPEIIVTLGFHVTRFILGIYNISVPNKLEIKSVFGNLYFAKNQKILPLRHPATVVHKSKSNESLIKDFQILKTLQYICPKHKNCFVPIKFRQGLLPEDYLEIFCYGNWKNCKYY